MRNIAENFKNTNGNGSSHPIDCSLRLDLERDYHPYSDVLKQEGRVRIPQFLDMGTEYLYNFARSNDEWIQVINTEDGVLEIELDQWQAYNDANKSAIRTDMYQRASKGFQYSYAAVAVPVAEEIGCEGDPLSNFLQFTAETGFQTILEQLTGVADLKFTDGQLTVYHPGDFLTRHDDSVAGKNRIAAFVLGLTPIWRMEWGGLLHFHPMDNEPALALVPDFNTLDLFTVPRLHSVSEISAAALFPRYALTGWLSK